MESRVLLRNRSVYIGPFFLLVIFILSTCKDKEIVTRSYPDIDTKPVSEINEQGASLNAEILNIGSSGISDHGFIYDRYSEPTLETSDIISLGETSLQGKYASIANRNLEKGVKYYVRAYAITKGNEKITVYGQTIEFISLGSSPPVIKDFSPKFGVAGDTVTVIGTGFSNKASNNMISLGIASTVPFKASSDTLKFIVTAATLVGESVLSIQVGQYKVVSPSKYLLKGMTLSSFTATASFGDTLTIDGTNFPRKANLITVTVLEKTATVINITSIRIKIVVPNDVTIAQGSIRLDAGAQTITSNSFFKLVAPVITSFSPLKATRNTEITVIGKYFSPVVANNKVVVNGTLLTITSASKTSLKATCPSGIAPGLYPVVVTAVSQPVISSTNLEIIRPVITGVSPLNGTWGSSVSIAGENFGATAADNVVRFNNIEAQIISLSSTLVTVQVPNNLLVNQSTISLQAISVDNQTATYGTPFQLNGPSLTGFTPISGKSGSTVTITGSNFNPVPASQTVSFGSIPAEILSASSNQLVVKVPAGLGETDVSIQVDVAGQSAIAASTFHSISPWKKVADYPDGVRAFAVSFVLSNLGYVTLGNTSTSINFDKPCYRYDPSTDQWSQVHSFFFYTEGSSGAYIQQDAFTLNGNAYVGFGITSSSQPREKLMKYVPTDDNWYQVAGLPSGNAAGVTFTNNGMGYLSTGLESNNLATTKTWEYDPGSDSWTSKASLPGQARFLAAGFSIGSDGFVAGGSPCTVCGSYLNDVWRYNLTSDQWTQMKPFPGAGRASSTAFAVNGVAYMVGGLVESPSGSNPTAEVWKYDPASDAWLQIENFPGGPRQGAVAFVINGKAYFGTGLGVTGYLSDFWEFDPSKL
ncbi:MAG: IPT/TIG domain-containing protein [Bacteroidetes bacterium]|nr:IPT/TIG domain-containing protein [Bacteroidota bacterium]